MRSIESSRTYFPSSDARPTMGSLASASRMKLTAPTWGTRYAERAAVSSSMATRGPRAPSASA